MALISLFIVSVVFYSPGFGLWQEIMESSIAIDFSLFGITTLRYFVPESGVILLFLYSLLGWIGLYGLFSLFEHIFSVDLLHLFRLRNGLIFSEIPKFTLKISNIIAKITIWYFIAKIFVNLLIHALLKTNFPEWLMSKLPIGNIDIRAFLNLAADFIGQQISNRNEWVFVILAIITLISYRYHRNERRQRHIQDLEQVGSYIKKSQHEIKV